MWIPSVPKAHPSGILLGTSLWRKGFVSAWTFLSRAVCLTSTPQWKRAKPSELGGECVVKKAELISPQGSSRGTSGWDQTSAPVDCQMPWANSCRITSSWESRINVAGTYTQLSPKYKKWTIKKINFEGSKAGFNLCTPSWASWRWAHRDQEQAPHLDLHPTIHCHHCVKLLLWFQHVAVSDSHLTPNTPNKSIGYYALLVWKSYKSWPEHVDLWLPGRHHCYTQPGKTILATSPPPKCSPQRAQSIFPQLWNSENTILRTHLCLISSSTQFSTPAALRCAHHSTESL